MFKNILALSITTLIIGCSPAIPTRNYTATNDPPSRFKIVSAEHYIMEPPVNDIDVIVLTDTAGTNDYLAIQAGHGVSILPLPKPVIQAEKSK